MNQTKRHSRFVGIDVAKNKHVACVIDRDGKVLCKSRSFANAKQGYQQLRETLKANRTYTCPLIVGRFC